MSFASELENLASLWDRGDLSQAEFEKAKERLLSGEVPEVSPTTEKSQP
ncbi:MAG: SHOCT domain-containing protein, partial [Akkermansiaceae bacterium]|nr:SHOCT domain-containing protein [Akkermansiaceae bacterium]